VTAVLCVVALAVLLAMALYLHTAAAHASSGGATPTFALAACFPRLARALARLPPTMHRQASAAVQIGQG